MPIYTYRCETCQGEPFDRIGTMATRNEQDCTTCGARLVRVFTANAAHTDEIPGGIEIKNGLCYPDGTPRRFYSKSELAKAARDRGLVNHVEHIGLPGTDKNPHTSRWV